jgi:signal peptidase I
MAQSVYEFSYTLRKQLKEKIVTVLLCIIAVLIFMHLIFTFIFSPVFVRTESMEPEIAKQSAVFMKPVGIQRPFVFNIKTIKRGDIVKIAPLIENERSFFQKTVDIVTNYITFQQYKPFSKNSSHVNSSAIYRVVGMPGDTIYMKKYVLYVKPKDGVHFLSEYEVSNVNYETIISQVPVNWDTSIGIQGDFSEITLEKDQYFLLCDNRVSYIDSRIFGAVNAEQITGVAKWQYYPFNSMQLLP